MKLTKENWAVVVVTVLSVALISISAPAEEKKSSNEKVAVVNGVTINQVAFQKELNFHLQRATQRGMQVPETQMEKLKKDVLESLIEREILYQESQKAGIKVEEKAIDEQLGVIKQRFPTEADYQNALKQMNFSEEDVKMQVKRGLAIKGLIDRQVGQKIIVTDEESKAYYEGNPQMFKQPEQVKASHILIKVESNADEKKKGEARQKIVVVQEKLEKGEDFAALAKEYSEGPSNVKGGDLGYFGRGQMVKPFEEAAFTMKPNEVSDIVETRFGYHLIKVYDKKPETVLAYAEVKDKLNQRMKQQKTEQEAGKYIDELKKDAKIEKFL